MLEICRMLQERVFNLKTTVGVSLSCQHFQRSEVSQLRWKVEQLCIHLLANQLEFALEHHITSKRSLLPAEEQERAFLIASHFLNINFTQIIETNGRPL